MAKVRWRTRDQPLLAESQDDELANSPFGTALLGDASARDKGQVRKAMEWWLGQLPAAGAELAVELQAPGDTLFEVFRRGRLAVYPKGHRLHEEGEEVRFYTIILHGRCRLRCRAPAPKTTTSAEPVEEEEATGIDADGFTVYDTIGRGEALGLVPQETKSPCEVQCAERTILLLLTPDDYAATLRPYHRQLQVEAVEFLQQYNVCPHGASSQLQRLVASFRQRRVRRGRMVLRAGDLQRHVWILKSGSCSVLADPQEELSILQEDEEGSESSSESEDDVSRLKRMQARPVAAAEAQAAAAEEAQRNAVAKYAKRCLSKNLQVVVHDKSFSAGPGPQKGLVATAVLRTPGLILGEEVLLFEARKQLSARSCTTLRADEECRFYVVDVTSFRQLGLYAGADNIAERVGEKLSRRANQCSRNSKVAKQLTKEALGLKRAELAREDQQRLRLPASVGYKGADVLEDVNEYLQVVFDHRKAPRNDKNPATLSVLEGLGINPMNIDGSSGRGVNTMLKLYGDPAALKQHRAAARWGPGIGGRRNSSASPNPMGEAIPANANYMEVAPPSRLDIKPPPLAIAPPPPSVSVSGGGGGGGGIFFQTEPELEEREQRMERSSSVPVLPRLGDSTPQERTLLEAARPALAPVRSVSSSAPALAKGVEDKAQQQKAEKRAQRLATQIMKAFHRVVPGKSIVVYTDRQEVRKSIMKALISTASEVDLVFVKNTAELLHRLRDPKEKHHALVLDLSKNELQVDGLLKCCREHKRYGNIPIIVLSADRELPEVVRSNCSFVVFHPVAASMLREALVWCFDRKTLLANSRYATPELTGAFGDEGAAAEGEEREFTVRAVAVPTAIPVS